MRLIKYSLLVVCLNQANVISDPFRRDESWSLDRMNWSRTEYVDSMDTRNSRGNRSLGVLNLFREINEEGDRITIRSYGGWAMVGLVLFFTGLIVGAICLGIGFIATGSDRSDLMMVGIAALVASPLGLLLWLVGPRMVVDYGRREITDGRTTHSFSDIAFVAITEWVKVIRTENGNNRVPMFNVVLGLGTADQAVLDEIVKDIRSTDVGEQFIAGDSLADEQAVDTFFLMTDLERLTLFQSGQGEGTGLGARACAEEGRAHGRS